MADLVKLISKVKYGDGGLAAITLGSPHNDSTCAVVVQRENDPKWASAQLWRREALTVRDGEGKSWVGFAFTIPSPNGGPRLALQYNGPNAAVSAAPYGDWIAQQLWRLAFQDYQNPAAPYAALGMFDPVHPIFLNLYGGVAQDNQPVYCWTENDGNVKVNEYWTMETAYWTMDGKKTNLVEAPGVEAATSVSVVKTVFAAAQADPNYFQLLLAEPASVFDAAGYSIPSEYAADFNKFYRSHEGVQELHAAIAAGKSLDSVASWACTSCQIGCWVLAIAIAAIGAGAAAYLTTASAPVVAMVAVTGLSARMALAATVALVTFFAGDVGLIIAHLCKLMGVC